MGDHRKPKRLFLYFHIRTASLKEGYGYALAIAMIVIYHQLFILTVALARGTSATQPGAAYTVINRAGIVLVLLSWFGL